MKTELKLEFGKLRDDKTVLVVDDSPSIREILKGILEEIGFKKIYLVGDGYGAIEEFKKLNPDITFLDMNLPMIDGSKVLKAMLSINPVAKVILITASPKTARLVTKAISEGACMYLEKPFDKGKVLQAIEKIEREERKLEGKSKIEHALATIEKIQSQGNENRDENFLVFEFNSSDEFNDFSLEISKRKNVSIRNLQFSDGKFVVTVSVYPKSMDRIM